MNPAEQVEQTEPGRVRVGPSPTRVLWLIALAISFVISVFAAFRGGYVGPDYNRHLAQVVDSTRLFDFSTPDPPLYILLSHALFRLIGRNNGFPITLAILQVAINTVALWYFFRFTERCFKSPVLHLALVFFLTFLPARMIHAETMGTDWMTIPVFVMVLIAFDRLVSQETTRAKDALWLGLVLALGIWSKYSFMALLPAIFVILVIFWWKRKWTLKQFVVIAALSLVPPTALLGDSYLESAKLKEANARSIWLKKGEAPDMDFKDILSVKKADLELFKAPEYFKKQILAAHKHSYLGLSHMGTFTDTMNLFQYLTAPQAIDFPLIPDQKARHAWKTPVMVASMSVGVIWTLLALIATPWGLFRALRNLWQRGALEREDSSILLGFTYFLLMFLPIPYVICGALFGYWTPRLILPCLFAFYLAAFLLVDKSESKILVRTTMLLVLIQCAIEIVMLT
jgi:4-amino-4-deoxy-L-arabinose transferase-like glycosyltransferase